MCSPQLTTRAPADICKRGHDPGSITCYHLFVDKIRLHSAPKLISTCIFMGLLWNTESETLLTHLRMDVEAGCTTPEAILEFMIFSNNIKNRKITNYLHMIDREGGARQRYPISTCILWQIGQILDIR